MNKKLLLVALILLTSLMGCRERIEPQSDDFVEYGWVLYGERDFTGAYAQFQEGLSLDSVYIDGYNGCGWCYIEFNNPDSAIYFFDKGTSYIQVDSIQVRFEMMAGLALSHHVNGDYGAAILAGTQLINLRPFFEFTHDWRINYVDIIAVVAASYYAQGNFSQSLTWVRKYDNTFSVDVSSLKGRADLIKKIEAIQNL